MNKKCENSGLLYNNLNLNKFNITNEQFNEPSPDTKHKHPLYFNIGKFFKKINELTNVKSSTAGTKKKKFIVNDAASKLFNEQKGELDNEYNELSNAEKIIFALDTILVIYFLIIVIIVIDLCHYKGDEKASTMPLLKGDEEKVKKEQESEY